MKPEQLLALLQEIEQEDPIDFSGLPFEAADLRQLACLNVVELIAGWPEGISPSDRELVMAATITRLVLENMVLQIRVAILTGDPEA